MRGALQGGTTNRLSRFDWRTNTAAAVAKVLGFVEQLVRIHNVTGLKRVVKAPDICDRPGEEVLADEIEWKILVPGGRDPLDDLEGFESVLDEGKLVVAVVHEVVVHGGRPQRMTVPQDNRPGR